MDRKTEFPKKWQKKNLGLSLKVVFCTIRMIDLTSFFAGAKKAFLNKHEYKIITGAVLTIR